MPDFDMPKGGTWETRGGWVLNALAAEFGLSQEQAAGPVGNLGFESTGFTKLHETGQPAGLGGYGWGQWTGPRRVKFLTWCREHGFDWQSDLGNYGYLLFELHNDYAYCLDAVRRESTIERSVFVFGRLYEAPGGTTATYLPGYAGRLQYGRRALAGAKIGLPVAPAAVAIPDARDMQAALGIVVDGNWGQQSQAALAAYYRQKPA